MTIISHFDGALRQYTVMENKCKRAGYGVHYSKTIEQDATKNTQTRATSAIVETFLSLPEFETKQEPVAS
jgi:hypothetical protein